MRAISMLALILSMVFLFSTQAKADEEITTKVYFNRAGIKILSGVANLTTGWMELPKNIILACKKDDRTSVDIFVGVLKGIFHTAFRTENGAEDLLTFWIPTHPRPRPPFIWDDFSKETDYYGWRMGW